MITRRSPEQKIKRCLSESLHNIEGSNSKGVNFTTMAEDNGKNAYWGNFLRNKKNRARKNTMIPSACKFPISSMMTSGFNK